MPIQSLSKNRATSRTDREAGTVSNSLSRHKRRTERGHNRKRRRFPQSRNLKSKNPIPQQPQGSHDSIKAKADPPTPNRGFARHDVPEELALPSVCALKKAQIVSPVSLVTLTDSRLVAGRNGE